MKKWNRKMDTLYFIVGDLVRKAEELKAVTKKNVLSLLASLFYPLGIISPVMVSMKILFQELCNDRVGWDAELGSESRDKLWKCVRSLESVLDLPVARRVSRLKIGCEKYTLNRFADASLMAYCAVTYMGVSCWQRHSRENVDF